MRRPARFLLRERDASNAKEASDGAQYLGVPLSASAHAAERSAHGIMVVLRLRVGMGVHGVPKATATLLTARLASLTNGQSNPNRISSHIRFATVMATPTRAPPVAEAAVRVRVCVGSAGFVSVSARPRLPRGFQMGSVGIGALGLGPGVGRAVGPAVGPRIGPGGSPGGGPGVDTPTAPSLTCGVEGCGGHRQRRSFSVSPAAAPAMPAPTATPRGGNSLNLGCSDCQSTQSAASSSVGSSVSSTPRTTGVTTWVGGGGVGGGAGGGACGGGGARAASLSSTLSHEARHESPLPTAVAERLSTLCTAWHRQQALLQLALEQATHSAASSQRPAAAGAPSAASLLLAPSCARSAAVLAHSVTNHSLASHSCVRSAPSSTRFALRRLFGEYSEEQTQPGKRRAFELDDCGGADCGGADCNLGREDYAQGDKAADEVADEAADEAADKAADKAADNVGAQVVDQGGAQVADQGGDKARALLARACSIGAIPPSPWRHISN